MDQIKIQSLNIYKEDINSILKQNCSWEKLKNKTILISGGTGLIGTYLVDMFLLLNDKFKLNLHLLVISRKTLCNNSEVIKFFQHDINEPFEIEERIDYIIHAASNTHPILYATEPVTTITTNFIGTYNLLNLASKNLGCKFIFVSSVEIYGSDNLEKKNGFSEKDFGYIDCNTLRAGYCEGKRASEALLQAYYSQYNLDFVIARLCRCYGPTMKRDDTKALSQFINNAIEGKNIVLKSDGTQFYSYIYAADAASSIIYVLLNGDSTNAYNVSNKDSDITLKNLAELIASYANVKVINDSPNEIEKQGFSKATRAILDNKKILDLGWKPFYGISIGIERTIKLLKEISNL